MTERWETRYCPVCQRAVAVNASVLRESWCRGRPRTQHPWERMVVRGPVATDRVEDQRGRITRGLSPLLGSLLEA